MNKVSFIRLENPIARFVLSPALKPCYSDSTAKLSRAARRVLRQPPLTNQMTIQLTAKARTLNPLQTPSLHVASPSELFPSDVTHVKSLIKKLPKEIFSLFPLFYAYLLYHYKAIHLQNINICISASSQRKIVNLTLGKGNREHRFAIEIKSGHPWKLLNLGTAFRDGKVMQDFEPESVPFEGDHSQKVKNPSNGTDSGSNDCVNLPSQNAVSRLKVEETKSPSPATNWINQIGNPFSFLIWKRHEFQTVYNIMIKDPLAPSTPRIASFTLPSTKAERLRIIQSQPKENIPVASFENLKEAVHKETYNTKRFLQISVGDSKSNLRLNIPSLREGKAPDEYVHIVQTIA